MKVSFTDEELSIATDDSDDDGSEERAGILQYVSYWSRYIVIGLVIIAAMAGILVWHPWNRGGKSYESPYDLADDFAAYTYQGDGDKIFQMQPKIFQERSVEDTMTRFALEGKKEAMDRLTRPISDYLSTLGTQHGQWTENHQVKEGMYAYEERELNEIRATLKMQGVDEKWLDEMTAAGVVDVDVNIEASNGSGGYSYILRVPVYEYKGKWYLGQMVGSVYRSMTEGVNNPYGDLLDGFSVTSGDTTNDEETKEDGAEDTQALQYDESNITHVNLESDHRYDKWGNIQYLDKEGNVIETVGPDGGEPLDEESYADYWDSHWDMTEEE